MKRYLGIILCVLLLLVGWWYFNAHREDFGNLFSVGPLDLAFLVGLNLVTRVLVGTRLKYLTSAFGIKVSVPEGAGLSLIQAYGNVVAIKGGTAGIAYYLYAKKGFGIDRFLAITGGGFVVTAMSVSLAGLAGVGIVSMSMNPGPEIPLFFSVILLGAFLLLVFPRFRLPQMKVAGFVNKVAEGWDMLRGNRGVLARLVIIEVSILMSFALRYYVAFRGFSQAIGLSQAFLLAPPAYLSLMIAFTPAGLGVREPLLAFMSGILGYTVKGGLGGAVLDSAVMVTVSLVLGPIAAAILMPGKKEGDDAPA